MRPRPAWSPPPRGASGPQRANRERADDVGDRVHQGPDAREHEKQVGLVDEELPAGPERQHDHQQPRDQPDPPERVSQIALVERLGRPEQAHQQEQEAEDVGDSGEGLLRLDQGDHAGRQHQHPEQRVEPAQPVAERGDRQVPKAGAEEHQADDHADHRDRGPIELEDDQGHDPPYDARHQPQPPVPREPGGRIATRRVPADFGQSGISPSPVNSPLASSKLMSRGGTITSDSTSSSSGSALPSAEISSSIWWKSSRNPASSPCSTALTARLSSSLRRSPSWSGILN